MNSDTRIMHAVQCSPRYRFPSWEYDSICQLKIVDIAHADTKTLFAFIALSLGNASTTKGEQCASPHRPGVRQIGMKTMFFLSVKLESEQELGKAYGQ